MTDLAIVGLGNIGLAFVEFAARTPSLRSILLIDPDVYTERNVACQMVRIRDAGRRKVDVAAERISEANPNLPVEKHGCRLEQLPRGLYRGCVIASCLDSRISRAKLCDIAWAAGAPLWLDAGVRPEGGLARVSATFPSEPEAACICCGWSPKDWKLVAREYSCAGSRTEFPSGSPVWLGATAASLMAHSLERFIAGGLRPTTEVQTSTSSLDAHRSWSTTTRRGADCRCRHESWSIEPLNRNSATCRLSDFSASTLLAVPGLPFATHLRCSCGASRSAFHMAGRLSGDLARCGSCGAAMSPGALDLRDEIALSALGEFGPEVPALALADLGISDGDIIRIGDRHLEVGASAEVLQGAA